MGLTTFGGCHHALFPAFGVMEEEEGERLGFLFGSEKEGRRQWGGCWCEAGALDCGADTGLLSVIVTGLEQGPFMADCLVHPLGHLSELVVDWKVATDTHLPFLSPCMLHCSFSHQELSPFICPKICARPILGNRTVRHMAQGETLGCSCIGRCPIFPGLGASRPSC